VPNSLLDRRQALEDRFFKDQEANKISLLRAKLAAKKNREELQSECGIDDAPILDALVKLAVGAQDLAALSLVPLIQVAWADGSVSDKESEAVLRAAAAQGITKDSHSYTLLESWLSNAPDAELFEAWTGYVEALRAQLEEEETTALRESIIGLAHDVAEAAGGYLGIGSVSQAEKAVLSAINEAFGG